MKHISAIVLACVLMSLTQAAAFRYSYPHWSPRTFASTSFKAKHWDHPKDAWHSIALAQGGSVLRREFEAAMDAFMDAIQSHPMKNGNAPTKLTYAERQGATNSGLNNFFLKASSDGNVVYPPQIMEFDSAALQAAMEPLAKLAASREIDFTNGIQPAPGMLSGHEDL